MNAREDDDVGGIYIVLRCRAVPPSFHRIELSIHDSCGVHGTVFHEQCIAMLMMSYANLSSEQNYGALLIESSKGGIVTLWLIKTLFMEVPLFASNTPGEAISLSALDLFVMTWETIVYGG